MRSCDRRVRNIRDCGKNKFLTGIQSKILCTATKSTFKKIKCEKSVRDELTIKLLSQKCYDKMGLPKSDSTVRSDVSQNLKSKAFKNSSQFH